MLHLLSVITAAAVLAAGVGLVGAEPIPHDQGARPADGASRDLAPGAEGRSVDTTTEFEFIPDDEEKDAGLPPED